MNQFRKSKYFFQKIFLSSKKKKTIKITPFSLSTLSNSKKKKIKSIQNTTTVLIKQLILESSIVLYQKLKLVGIGYRVFNDPDFKELLSFKLGNSHPIYFKISNKLHFFCLKSTKLFVFGNSYQQITQIASIIRSQKKPEPYKGKGILYENEKIILKEGKKV